MPAAHPLVLGLVAFAAAASLLAQERRPLLGTVVDAEGKALARATVQVAHVPIGAEHLPAADHATATTDERGRFRIDVRPCTTYLVWATGPRGEDGTYLASAITQSSAGMLLELRAATRHDQRHLAIPDTTAWAAFAPLQVRLVTGGAELPGRTFPLRDVARVELPPLPDAFTTFEILDKDGGVLRADTRRSATNTNLTITPVHDVPLLVVDDKGAAVAGATVTMRTSTGAFDDAGLLPSPPNRTHWRTLGQTDADGRLLARIPSARDPFQPRSWPNLFLVAHKPGRAAAVSGHGQHVFHDGKQVVDAALLAKKELRFTLGPAAPLRVRFTLGTKPLADTLVTVRCEFRVMQNKGNGWSNEELVWHRRTDADGQLVVEDLPADCHETAFAVAADAAQLQLPAERHKECGGQPLALLRVPAPPRDGATFDLATCKPLRLTLLDQHKAPAREARVLLVSRGSENSIDGWAPRAVPTVTGHATLLVQPGKWTVFVRDETGFAHLDLDGDVPGEATLQLEPMPACRGRVVDSDGKPVAGLQLQGTSMSVQGMGNASSLETIAQAMCWTWIQRTRTAADGTFDFRMLTVPTMEMKARFQEGKRGTEEFRLVPGDELLTLTIR